MKKMLILTYFFPPSNFAGSYRIASFAKYFHKFGYFPVIVTRHAPENAGNFSAMAKSCGNEIKHVKNEAYEVYYLPYKANLRDRIFAKYGEKKYSLFRKILSMNELILQFFCVRAIPYSNIYFFSKKYLNENKDIEWILASGRPYQLFKFANKLSKQFNIKWIADYRDEWNTLYLLNDFKLNIKEKLSFFYETILEKKWTKNAFTISTVTDHWANNLSTFLNKPAKVILNGYDAEILNKYTAEGKNINKTDHLKILHLGSLYHYQPIEIFFKTIVKLLAENFNITCYFPGVLYEPGNKERIASYTSAYPKNFVLMERINQEEVFKLMTEADVFLMIGYQNVKGWMSSKILEYLPWQKPVILCPSDNNELEQVLYPFSKSFICNTEESLEASIINIYNNKEAFQQFNEQDALYAQGFSREKQVEIFARYLDDYQKHDYENIKVLCFHRVSDIKSAAYPPMPVKVFERLIVYLIKKFDIISFKELHKQTSKPKLIITFDDGYEDFLTDVLPIIKKHNVKVLLSLIPHAVETSICPWSQILNKCIENALHNNLAFEIPEIDLGKRNLSIKNVEKFAVSTYLKLSLRDSVEVEGIIENLKERYKPILTPMLSWEQLLLIKASGLVDFASHSLTHANLTAISDIKTLEKEIILSKQIIEDKLSTKVEIFTPPGGNYNSSTEKLVYNNGYRFLLKVDDCIWNTSRPNVSRILMPYTGFYKNLLMINQFIPKLKSKIKIIKQ